MCASVCLPVCVRQAAGASTREVVGNGVYAVQSLQLQSWRLPPSDTTSTMLQRLVIAAHGRYGERKGCAPVLKAMAAVVQCKADNGGYGPCISLGEKTAASFPYIFISFPCVFPEPVLISHRLFACVCMRVCTYMLWTGRGICRCEAQASIETLIAEQSNERGSGEDGGLLKLRYFMQTPSFRV